MKRISILLIVSIVLNTYAQTTKKALFLGNSYTYGNDLPQLIKNLATANGDVFIKDQNTPGGHQLIQHSTNTTSLSKIKSNNWDYVILQEQSQKPSFPPGQVATDVKPYAVILNDSIKSNNSCSKTLFFMTWGRKNGDQQNCVNYAPLCTYEGMQGRLRESYLEMTVENNADCAPVGVAWKKMREDFPAINLYTSDESHPNINGSYLAACVFYTSMYNKSTVGNTYWASLDSLTAFRIQNIASSTVLDSLSTWSIEPQATNFETNDTTIEFCDSVEVLGDFYYTNTMFSDTVNSVGSCGEITNYTLEIGAETIDSIINFCDSVEILGNWYFASTSFSDITNGTPCNVIVNYQLNKTLLESIDSLITFCDSVEVLGNFYYTNTMFSDTVNGVGSCGEITNYTLEIGAETTDSIISFCDSVEVLGNWYFASTSFSDITNGTPCNVIVNYDINKIEIEVIDTTIFACDSILINGNWILNTTNFSDTTNNTQNCGQTITNYFVEINGSDAEITFFNQIHLLKTEEQTGIYMQIGAENFDSLFLYNEDTVIFASDTLVNFYTYNCGNDNFSQMDFTLVATNACNSDSSTNSFNCSGYSSINKLNTNNWNIYPNPSNHYIFIENIDYKYFSTELLDIRGKTIITKSKKTSLDVSTFDKGIYFLVIYDKDNVPIGQKRVIVD